MTSNQPSAQTIITNNLQNYILSLPGTQNCTLSSDQPNKNLSQTVSPGELENWEKTHSLKLPIDLKNFYEVTNGLTVKWYVAPITKLQASNTVLDMSKSVIPTKTAMSSRSSSPIDPTIQKVNRNGIHDDESILAGDSTINRFDKLQPIKLDNYNPVLSYQNRISFGRGYISNEDELETNSIKAFALENVKDYGTICLLYYETQPSASRFNKISNSYPIASPSIWLKDRACNWWYICRDISSYIRLMTVHLGIKGWWLTYTDFGVDPNCESLMRRFCPERVVVDMAFTGAGAEEIWNDFVDE